MPLVKSLSNTGGPRSRRGSSRSSSPTSPSPPAFLDPGETPATRAPESILLAITSTREPRGSAPRERPGADPVDVDAGDVGAGGRGLGGDDDEPSGFSSTVSGSAFHSEADIDPELLALARR